MVDEVDLKILNILESDSSTSFSEIARKLQLNESTVRKRVLALMDKQVIKRFSVSINPQKIGLNTIAIIGVDVDPPKLLEAAQKICDIRETKYVATSTGDHMIMCEVWAEDGKALLRIVSEKLGKIDGVTKICPAIILEKLKG
ncbi:MAG TPA: Lrp/AsnC family transcriptional regulator [archaeon]|nr:Lrp/AsnC family transcriptional regulator [archaeon]